MKLPWSRTTGTTGTATGSDRGHRTAPAEMATHWNALAEVAKEPLSEDARAELGLPATLRPIAEPGAVQRLVFEPATRQHTRSYRASEPEFTDATAADRWRQARRAATSAALTAIAGSEWAGHLVLRGSVLLKSWLGAAAREPGDLDFVVIPQDWDITAARTAQMLTGIAKAAQGSCAGTGVAIDAAGAVCEDIWTYERVPGRRMMLPWTTSGGQTGELQLDFVFNEPLPIAPQPAEISLADDTPKARILSATRELSLAWKIQWLVTDSYPQAKDLYDAVLLAECTPLSHGLLRRVMIASDPAYERIPVTLADITGLKVDADAFRADYPDLGADPHHLTHRLAEALTPTFAPAAPSDTYAQAVAWLARFIRECHETCHATGMAAVQQQLADEHVHPATALAVTRELMGPTTHSITDALALITKHQPPRWPGDWRESMLRAAAAGFTAPPQTPPAATGPA